MTTGSDTSGSAKGTTLDQGGLSRRMSGSQELLDMFLELFSKQFPFTLEKLESAIAANEADLIMREAHTIKSLLQNFFVGDLIRFVHEVEIAGRQLDLKKAHEYYLFFSEELEKCEPMLSSLASLRLQ
jgi:HPt (histidine-containing phosphotransfer) domain-containing protein